MRLYELAREIGASSADLLKVCERIGVKVSNRLSGLSDQEAARIREACARPPTTAAEPKPAVQPAAPTKASAAQPTAPARTSAAQPSAPAGTPAEPPRPAAPVKPAAAPAKPQIPPKLKLADEAEEGRPAAHRRRKIRTAGSDGDEELLVTAPVPVLGRYIPPATIPRYPRKPMRRQKARAAKRPGTPALEKPVSREVTAPISVRDLSAQLGIKANLIILKLMQAGLMVNVNAILTAEQVTQLVKDLNLDVTVREIASVEATLEAIEKREDRPEDLQPRAPVVTFLGHVDHGKTSLLDRIRKTDVAAHEHGGITQHIGANRVTISGKTVVFLDTPGHEAFTAMRARGANVTDIAVLVVAADDGVMPQTEEAIDHARAAGVPIVVAVNKCDKPEANPTRVRQQLAKLGLQPEEWGGDVVCVDVSAATGQGVDELMEMLALVAELRDLKANPSKPGRGTVLEARVSESLGPVATVLIQDGTAKVGDVVLCGATYGRIKALYDDRNRRLQQAGPSWPVTVVGLAALPEPGDKLLVLDDLQKARAIAEERQRKAREAVAFRREHVSLENLFSSIEAGRVKELRLIVKADVRGTLDAVQKVLTGISSPEVRLTVLRASVGAITTSDVLLADASDAVVVGMNVVPESRARALAEQKGVSIHTYNVIYRLKEEIEKALAGMLAPEEREVIIGHAEVRKIFHISRVGNVAGCYVKDGVILRSSRIRLLRDGAVIHTGRIGSLRREKDDVREVREGFECGIHIEGYDDVKVGDIIEAFQVEQVQRTLGPQPAPAGG